MAVGWPFESKYAGTPRIWGATAGGKVTDVGVVWGLAPLLAGGWEREAGPGRCWEMVDRPARREMRSARSASRLFCEACWWWPPPRWLVVARAWPRLPSLMAVVDRAEREVVVDVGVPLEGRVKRERRARQETEERRLTGLPRECLGPRARAGGRSGLDEDAPWWHSVFAWRVLVSRIRGAVLRR